MKKKVIQYIEEEEILEAGDRVLVGVSGGADSLALLYFLHQYADDLEIVVAAAHLHHGIRGEMADADEKFVRDFCEQRKIGLYSKGCDIQKIAKTEKISIEEAGRKERYAFFRCVASENDYNRVALGHHMGDQVETMLMRLIRGTGMKGVSGMKAVREHAIIRPFLCLQKKEILDYCKKNRLSYRNDNTNFQKDYTRNKIRLDILPQILDINPRAELHFNTFSKMAAEYEGFFQKHVDDVERQILTKETGRVILRRDLWLKEEPVVQKEILRRAIHKFKSSLKEIEYNHVKACCRLLKSDNTTWEVDLPNKIRIVRAYDRVMVTEKKESPTFFIEPKLVEPEKTYLFTKERLIVEIKLFKWEVFLSENDDFSKEKEDIFRVLENLSKESKNHCEKFFDYDKMGHDLFLRSRKSGDFFSPVGMQGKKSVKKYLIDEKIDRHLRNHIPMIAKGNEIIWIVGYAINRNFLVDKDTKKIMRIRVVTC